MGSSLLSLDVYPTAQRDWPTERLEHSDSGVSRSVSIETERIIAQDNAHYHHLEAATAPQMSMLVASRAKELLDPTDRLRRSNPDDKLGWNADGP